MPEETTKEPKTSEESKKEEGKEKMTETQKKIAPPKWYGWGHESPDEEARFLEFEFFDA